MIANAKTREKTGFLKRLSIYNKPAYLIFTGLFFSMIAGALLPLFGIFWAKLIIVLGQWEDARPLCLYLLIFAPVSFVVIYLGRGSWSYLAENMTKDI